MTTNNTVDNFTIYDELYHTSQIEALALNLSLFNEASQGAISLTDRRVIGNFEKHTVFDLADTVDHRNTSSVSTVSDGHLEDSERVDVKTNLRYKPIMMTRDSWRKKGMSSAEFSSILGRQNAVRKQEYLVGLATAILSGYLSNQAGVTTDITSASTDTVTTDALAQGLSKFGDQAGGIVCWVMHSKPYWNLVRSAISEKIYNEAGLVVYGGSPGTLGKPVIITDGGLHTAVSPGQDIYYTLGLTAGAMDIVQSEPDEVVADEVTGLQNLAWRIQGEFAVNIGMRNLAWNTTANPNPAALATHSNWTALFTGKPKLLPGVVIKSN